MEISTINAQSSAPAIAEPKDLSSEAAGFSSYMASAEEPKMVLSSTGHMVDQSLLNGSQGVPYDPYPYTDFTDWFPQLAKEYDFNALWGTPENLDVVRQLNENTELNTLPAVERTIDTGVASAAKITPEIKTTPETAPEIVPQIAPETSGTAANAAAEESVAEQISTESGTIANYHSQVVKSYISDSGTAVLMALLEQEMKKDDE
jgi:hypothetical protein